MTEAPKQARTRRSPDKAFASAGAVAQTGGSLPIYICNACEHDVVWCESKRTGKKYLVTVRRGFVDQRFYIGSQIHKCEEATEKALYRGSEEWVQKQIEEGVDEDMARRLGERNPFNRPDAAKNGTEEWIEFKIAQGFDPEVVRAAAAEDRLEILAALKGGK